MSQASEKLIEIQTKCFCKCYNMLVWKQTFKNDEKMDAKEKPYSCGTCKKGFSPADNVIVHKLIHTLTLLNAFNIFDKNFITKQNLTAFNSVSGNEKHCSTSETSSNKCSNAHDLTFNIENCHSTSEISNTSFSTKKCSISLVQGNKTPHSSCESNSSLLTNDRQSFTTANPYLCNLCRRSFAFESHLAIHQIVYCNEARNLSGVSNKIVLNDDCAGKNSYLCTLCGESFALQQDLTSHRLVHLSEKPQYSCSECGTLFRYKELLMSHILLHDRRLPYCCSICYKVYEQKHSLYPHIRTHFKKNSEDCYSCKECLISFTSRKEVIHHLNAHAIKNPCSSCNKIYKQKNGIVFYNCVHVDKKSDVCDVCNKRFSSKYYLKSHLLIHTGEKPYSCGMCPETFRYKSSLKIHSLLHNK